MRRPGSGRTSGRAGLALSDPARGLSAEFRARGLLTHEADGMRERGVSGTLSFDPAPDTERGLSFQLMQRLGGPSSGGAERLLGRGTREGLAANDNGDDLRNRRLDGRVGYGLGVSGERWTAVPELGLELSKTEREVTLGSRLTRAAPGETVFELGAEARRLDRLDGGGGPDRESGSGSAGASMAPAPWASGPGSRRGGACPATTTRTQTKA